MDFGAEWLVRSWPGPGPVLGGRLVLRAVTLAQEDGSGGRECLIEDDTALLSLSDVASLDDWRDTLVSTAEAQARRTSEPVVTQVGLPSGHTVRADWESMERNACDGLGLRRRRPACSPAVQVQRAA